jgi:hypothetical protein
VRSNVMRGYDPRGKKGAWTREEDKELLRYALCLTSVRDYADEQRV